jgi:ABC-type dipeptide/oligopeptide/nickel transport system permease subunit
MSTPAMTVDQVAGPTQAMRSRQWTQLLRTTLGMWRARIGLVIVAILVLIALAGPLIAPHSPTEFIAAPNSPPSGNALFGATSGAAFSTAVAAFSACRWRRRSSASVSGCSSA